jgi:hypothetical protein
LRTKFKAAAAMPLAAENSNIKHNLLEAVRLIFLDFRAAAGDYVSVFRLMELVTIRSEIFEEKRTVRRGW